MDWLPGWARRRPQGAGQRSKRRAVLQHDEELPGKMLPSSDSPAPSREESAASEVTGFLPLVEALRQHSSNSSTGRTQQRTRPPPPSSSSSCGSSAQSTPTTRSPRKEASSRLGPPEAREEEFRESSSLHDCLSCVAHRRARGLPVAALARRTLEKHLTCPITRDVMQDPVVAADGHTYERKAITQWRLYSSASPLTNLPLESTLLRPAEGARSLIAELVALS